MYTMSHVGRYTLPLVIVFWIGTPYSPSDGGIGKLFSLLRVGFETLYPGAIVGLEHPAPGNGWI
jgi:hypothetical protein